jgi:hypothetical protein
VTAPTAQALNQPELEDRRLVDRLDPRLVNVLTVVGFVLPVAVYLWNLGRYTANTIYEDQWSDIAVIYHPTWGTLWAQHNENRIFFPNLIAITLAHTVQFNITVEEWLSAGMLAMATALVIWAHKRRTSSAPWIYYCPVALLAFSIVQYGNTLWGFQVAWYLVLLCLAITIVLIDSETLTWPFLVVAGAAAVIGSFSSLQGLLIWPVGLLLLFYRRRNLTFAGAWIAAAVVTGVVYFWNFDFSLGNPCARCHHGPPTNAVNFFLFLLGDVLGTPPGAHHVLVLLFGAVILILAVTAIAVYGARRDESTGRPIGIGLICFGLLFAIITTKGRDVLGYVGASASRYTTYDLLIVVGIYLTLLGRPKKSKSLVPVVRWAAAAVIVLQLIFGLQNGLQGSRRFHHTQLRVAKLVRLDSRGDDTLLDFGQPPSVTRREVHEAKELRLSLFAHPNRHTKNDGRSVDTASR